MIKYLIIVSALCLPVQVSSQSEWSNALTGGVLFLPAKSSSSSSVLRVEIERYLKRSSGKNSLTWRAQHVTYNEHKEGLMDPYAVTEDGNGGLGFGFSYRHFFKEPYGGFYIETATDIAAVGIKRTYFSRTDSAYHVNRRFVLICPAIASGYRFISKGRLSVTSQIILGYRIDLTRLIDFGGSYEDKDGVFIGVGLNCSYRF